MHAITASYRQGSRESKRKLFPSQSSQGRPSPRFVPSTFSLPSSSLTYRQMVALLPTFHISNFRERQLRSSVALGTTRCWTRAARHMYAGMPAPAWPLHSTKVTHTYGKIQRSLNGQPSPVGSGLVAAKFYFTALANEHDLLRQQTSQLDALSATTSVSPSMPPTDRRVTFMESWARVPSHATWLWVLSMKVLNHVTHFS